MIFISWHSCGNKKKVRSPGRDIELFSSHFLSRYHKIVSHYHKLENRSHKLASHYHKIVNHSHKLESRYLKILTHSHKLESRYHKILIHSHKLAKSLPEDTNSFPQVSKVVTTRY